MNYEYVEVRLGDIHDNPALGGTYRVDEDRLIELKGSHEKTKDWSTLAVIEKDGRLCLAAGGHKTLRALKAKHGDEHKVTVKKITGLDDSACLMNLAQEKLCGLHYDVPDELFQTMKPVYLEAVNKMKQDPSLLRELAGKNNWKKVQKEIEAKGRIGKKLFLKYIKKNCSFQKVSEGYTNKIHKAIELALDRKLDENEALRPLRNYHQLTTLLRRIEDEKIPLDQQHDVALEVVKGGNKPNLNTGGVLSPEVNLLTQADDIIASLRSAKKLLEDLKKKKAEFRGCSKADDLWDELGEVHDLCEEIDEADDSDVADANETESLGAAAH